LTTFASHFVGGTSIYSVLFPDNQSRALSIHYTFQGSSPNPRSASDLSHSDTRIHRMLRIRPRFMRPKSYRLDAYSLLVRMSGVRANIRIGGRCSATSSCCPPWAKGSSSFLDGGAVGSSDHHLSPYYVLLLSLSCFIAVAPDEALTSRFIKGRSATRAVG
jgi:hypothetical protein